LLYRKFYWQLYSWNIEKWIKNVWDCSTHSANRNNHHRSETIITQPMSCNVNNIHICALMNNLTDNTNKWTSINIQAGFCLCDFVVCNFTVTQVEYLRRFSNLCDNVRFNAIWHRRYMIIFSLKQCSRYYVVPFVLCWRLAESDVTVMPVVMHIDYISDIITAAHLVSYSAALALITVSEKCKSMSHSAIWVKNWWPAIHNEEKLD
jgi:hypothetical protein